jgi:hypothetical protein
VRFGIARQLALSVEGHGVDVEIVDDLESGLASARQR